MPDRSIHLGLWIIAVVIMAALAVGIGVFVAVTLFRALMLLRGIRPCEDCGRRLCQVEVRRDLSLEHKGVFEWQR